jgi:RNA polymerase sigma factor (sigma-70 family)
VAKDGTVNLMECLRRAVLAGSKADRTDGQLLEDYLSRRDEAAVAALVRRHGPMVWGVCRRVLRNHHDAEDAFQATFLVLVRKAASVLPREMVGNWLYGVAHQTALKARATAAKRQARERQVKEMPEPAAKLEAAPWPDLEPLLDQELSRLPDKYRVAIVLCDLEGKTRKEAARQLKVPEGTLSTRLRTARTMLAKRMARHGLPVSGGAVAAVLTEKAASAGVPTSVVSSTIKAATLLAAGQAAGVISVKVAALTEGVLKAMFLTKLKTVSVVVLVVAALCGSVGLIYQTQAAEPPKAHAATDKGDKQKQPVAKKGEKQAPDEREWFDQLLLKSAKDNLKSAKEELRDAAASYSMLADDDFFKKAALERMDRARANLRLAETNLKLAQEAQTKKQPAEKPPQE